MASSRRLTSNFPSGHDRYQSLQQVSSRILSRAGTLNSMEERELNRKRRQLEYKEGLKEAHYQSVKKRLCDNLKDHVLYRRALRNSLKKKSRSEVDLRTSVDVDQSRGGTEGGEDDDDDDEGSMFGRYYGRTHPRFAEAMLDLEYKMRHSEKEKTKKLLEISRNESDILIDRKLTTDQILKANHLPLSERLRVTNTEKFQSIINRTRAIYVLNKMRNKIAERKEKEKGLRIRKSSKGEFCTKNSKTDIPLDTDLLIE
ncbi:uncharacterized protein LOC121427697 [Lytechinus variegatus]|uniref:uncharacterized protein LOC121427697 n=1 Tax=Lytechinus variegatus TaxID=7654 RepID=UPI001BB19F65|nr:uncharacterized protein LOC121427697 [Lytechinus variegatus]